MSVLAVLSAVAAVVLAGLLAKEQRRRAAAEDDRRRAEREARNAELSVVAADPPEAAEIPEPAKTGPPASPTTNAKPPPDRRPAVVRLTLLAANEEWLRKVREPPKGDASIIDGYIRRTGLGWPNGKKPPGRGPYERNGDFAWCGAFAAHCLAAAGLDPAVRKKVMPSTYRIWQYATDKGLFVDGHPEPGDIVLVGPKKSRWGAHITICRSFDPDTRRVLTVEGNAKGQWPDDTRQEGVIHHARPLSAASDRTYRVRFVVRLPLEDFDVPSDRIV